MPVNMSLLCTVYIATNPVLYIGVTPGVSVCVWVVCVCVCVCVGGGEGREVGVGNFKM